MQNGIKKYDIFTIGKNKKYSLIRVWDGTYTTKHRVGHQVDWNKEELHELLIHEHEQQIKRKQ